MDKRIFTAIALLAAGYAAGEVDVMPEANAKQLVDNVNVTRYFASDAAALQTIKGKVFDVMCPIAESEDEGLSTGDCSVLPGTEACFVFGDDADATSKTKVEVDFPFTYTGTFIQ